MDLALTPRDSAIAAGWASVRFILGVVCNLFGAPAELAALKLLPRGWRAEIVAWLRPAESLVRRLLLIRAADLAAAAPLLASPPAKRSPHPLRRPTRPRATPEDEPARWARVRFNALLKPRGAERARRRGCGAPTPFTAVALAERLEALIRVVQGPDPAARRLARTLLRLRLRPPRPGEPPPDPVGRVLRPVVDHPDNPAREAMKRLAPLTDQADTYFSSG